jgi:hypothetical protein
LLESELRARERQLREAREEVARLEFHSEALQRELWALHQGAPRLPPEHTAQVTSVRRIVLGRQTGSYDQGRKSGGEGLQVVIEPRDGEDQRIKAPGAAHIDCLEISPEGLKTPLSSWEVSPEQLRRTWREGLFGTGYYVLLPWKEWPSSPQLRVVVRFTVPDGRLFEADRDVTVRSAPPAWSHSPPPGEPRGPLLSEPTLTLPPPRKLEPAPPGSPSVPPPPTPPDRPAASDAVEPTAHWRPGPADGAVYLRRPLPLRAEE